MNISNSIHQSLENQNKDYHEASECISCTPNTKIRNATWFTLDNIEEKGVPGIVTYFDGYNVLTVPFSHAVNTGCTGSGKTEVFYKNQLDILRRLSYDKRPSIMITDPKGTMHISFKKKLEDMGYDVQIVDMRNPQQSAKYNPLLQIYDDYQEALSLKKKLDNNEIEREFNGKRYTSPLKARIAAEYRHYDLMNSVERGINEMAYITVPVESTKDRCWSDGARTMLMAIMWTMLRDSENPENGMTREKFTLANVCHIASSTDNDCEDICNWLDRADDIQCVRSALTGNYRLKAKITRDGYVSTLGTALAEYASIAVDMITATTDEISIPKIASSEKPYAIFVITDERQKSTNGICMMFMNNLINGLVAAADRNPTHSLPRDFVVFADEFANMPEMPNISNKITTLRSRRIWMVMAIQSIQQLDMIYGKDVSSIIRDNCDLEIFLGCNNDETKEAFARSMGRKIGTKTGFSIANDGSISISKGTEDVPVVRKSDLDALNLGEFYVRSRQTRNFKSYMIPYFMQNNIEEPKYLEEDFEVVIYDPKKYVYEIGDVLKREPPQRSSFFFDF